MGILLKNGLVLTQNSNRDMRFASLIQKLCSGINSTPVNTIFNIATLGGAKALGLQDQIGSIEVVTGSYLTISDLIPADYIYSQIVYSANASNVQHVLINGKWTVYDSELMTIAENQLLSNVWTDI